MPGIRANRYSDPALGAAMENIAEIFRPPSAADMANYANAQATNQKTSQIAQIFQNPNDPHASARAALIGVQGYGQTPEGFTYQVDQNNATQRYGYDLDAQTTLATNAADNQRSFLQSRYASPIAQDAMLPAVPADVAGMFGIDAQPQVAGMRSPLSETQWLAQENAGLRANGAISDDMLLDALAGDRTPVQALGPDGKTPIYMSPGAAVRQGATPAPSSPSTVVNMGSNGVDYGKPDDGLVWARNADGTVRLDERGAPVAIPYQGGARWEEMQAATNAAAALDQSKDLKSNIVLQNIDRSLDAIEANPVFTTGLGAQATSWVGGSPARAVQALLDPILANIGFDQLQSMRDASPTGGALGQVTEREISFLQSILGSINPEAGPQVIDDIKRVKNIYLDTIHGAGQGPARERLSFPSQWDEFAEQSGQAQPGGAAPANGAQPEQPVYAVNPSTGERLVLRNGQWVPAA